MARSLQRQQQVPIWTHSSIGQVPSTSPLERNPPHAMSTPISGHVNNADIAARVSYLSSVTKHDKIVDDSDNDFRVIKTPDAQEDGALRGGGRPELLSKDYIGLLAQYATVGLVYGTLPATLYPLLQEYLNTSGATYSAADTLVVLPWSFKVFYGMLSDCFPIMGYRRRPYMLIGWTMCFIMLVVMACSPVGKPYYPDPSYRDLDPDSSAYAAVESTFNTAAPGKGAKYVILMMLAAVGYLMSDVCADGVVVELAQREPTEVRGTTQSTIYGVRTFFVTIGYLLTGFAFNGKDYGGDYDATLSFPQLMIILAVCTVPVFPMTWFYIKEEKVQQKMVFRDYINDMWTFLQQRAVYQIVFYNFFSGIFANFSYTASSPIQSYMVGVTPLNNSLSNVFGNLVFLFGIFITGKWGLHWNWRWMIVVTGIIVIVVDLACTMIVVWDVYRSQWFWLGPPVAVQVPAGISFIISTFVTVELAKVGNEGAVYGMLTTVTNLSSPFASTLTRIADKPFNLSNTRIQRDDHSIRMDITYAVILMYCMTILSWAFLPLLPNQKAQTQELVRRGGTSKLFGGLTVFYCVFALIWSVTVNILSIFESTSCLVIAGGDGC